MDSSKNRWAWLPEFMPRVRALLAEKRKLLGDAHVNKCWELGVLKQEPGWFFAREGAIAIGVPDGQWKDIATWGKPMGAVLILRDPEPASGTH